MGEMLIGDSLLGNVSRRPVFTFDWGSERHDDF